MISKTSLLIVCACLVLLTSSVPPRLEHQDSNQGLIAKVKELEKEVNSIHSLIKKLQEHHPRVSVEPGEKTKVTGRGVDWCFVESDSPGAGGAESIGFSLEADKKCMIHLVGFTETNRSERMWYVCRIRSKGAQEKEWKEVARAVRLTQHESDIPSYALSVAIEIEPNKSYSFRIEASNESERRPKVGVWNSTLAYANCMVRALPLTK